MKALDRPRQMDSLTPGHSGGPVRVNGYRDFFALVGYIPDPLGAYLNRLRAELIAGCNLRSHVTILPPRMLRSGAPLLVEELSRRLLQLQPFEIELGEIEVFETTGVIFIAIQRGWTQLLEFHTILEQGVFWFEEYFPFHPHMTLAQGIDGQAFEATLEKARESWRKCPFPRSFQLGRLTLVRNVDPDRWDTISEHALGPVSAGINPPGIERSGPIPGAVGEPSSPPQPPTR